MPRVRREERYSRARSIHMGEIVSVTKSGRSNADEIILVNPFWLAIEDIALATTVYRKAQEFGQDLFLER